MTVLQMRGAALKFVIVMLAAAGSWLAAGLLTNAPGANAQTNALSMEITDSPDPVLKGDEVIYTVTVTNTAAKDVDNVFLSLRTVGFAVTEADGCSQAASDTFDCQLGSLTPGSHTVTLKGDVNVNAGDRVELGGDVTGKASEGDTTTASAVEATTVTAPRRSNRHDHHDE